MDFSLLIARKLDELKMIILTKELHQIGAVDDETYYKFIKSACDLVSKEFEKEEEP